jgi:F0F1-type ATP synthase alpha subunit
MKKDHTIILRATADEKIKLQLLAKKHKMSLSNYLRYKGNESAQ